MRGLVLGSKLLIAKSAHTVATLCAARVLVLVCISGFNLKVTVIASQQPTTNTVSTNKKFTLDRLPRLFISHNMVTKAACMATATAAATMMRLRKLAQYDIADATG
jgi:hypothetical protein